jgi:hypothetical protein
MSSKWIDLPVDDEVTIVGPVEVTQGTTPWVVTGTVTTSPDVNIHDSLGNSLSSIAGSLNVDVTNTINAAQSGAWSTGRTWVLDSSTDSVNIGNFPSTFAVTQGTSPWIISGTVTANAGTGTFLVDGSAHTQPVSGSLGRTWTLNSGTDSVTVTGSVTTSPNINVHDGTGVSISSTGSSLNVDVTNTVPVSQSGTWNIGTLTSITNPVTVTGTLAVTQSTSPWADNITQFGGNNVVTGTGISGLGIPRVTVANDSNILATQSGAWTTGRTWTLASGTDSVAAVQSGNWSTRTQDGSGNAINSTSNALNVSVQNSSLSVTQGTSPWIVSGDSASGAAKAGNPVQIGGVFNTTQPTVTTGQTVESQATARGALIVATGVDAFTIAPLTNSSIVKAQLQDNAGNALNSTSNALNVSIQNASIAVTQSTSPWVISGTVVTSNFPTTVDTNYGTVGASTIRTAAEIGNATGAANFNYGTVGAQSLRTAAQIGNATGAADFNAGATGAQTVRVTANICTDGGTALTSTLFNSKQGLDVVPNNGFSTASNTRVAVDNSVSVQLLAANLNRKYAYVMNNTGKAFYLKLGAAAVGGQGILLSNNGLYEITGDNLWTGTVNAISSSSTSTSLDVFEGTP